MSPLTSSSTTTTVNLAGSKLRKQLSASLQEHASAPTSKFARQQLEKMGWKEGTGLGKNRDGIASHIRVQKRQEAAGLGSEKRALQIQQEADQWWKNSIGDTLSKLAAGKNNNNKKKKKKKTKTAATTTPKHYTDEELFEATGGARFGMRAGKTRNLAKWKRTESESAKDLLSSASSAAAPQAEAENKTTVEVEKPKKKSKKRKKDDHCEEENVVSESETRASKKRKKDKKKKRKQSADL